MSPMWNGDVATIKNTMQRTKTKQQSEIDNREQPVFAY